MSVWVSEWLFNFNAVWATEALHDVLYSMMHVVSTVYC